MAFLGLFSKRDKHKTQDSATDHTTSAASDLDPSEPDYVLPSSSRSPTTPSIYSAPGASSSKLKLGFKAKKSPVASRTDSNLLSPPTSAYFNVRSESENNLLSPPPPRSAVFAGYNDPSSAHSTRSLPTHPASHSRSDSKELVDLNADTNLPVPPKQNKGGIFSWAHRERKKSKAPPPPSPSQASPIPDISLDSESFNLRSFRHVRPESPPTGSPPSILPPVRPRPREGSFVSESSQRISVAAFREAQARRSAANSPVPSFSHDPLSPGSSTGLRPPSTFALRNSRSISGESDTDDDSDEEEDSEASSTLKPRRHRSAKQPKSPPVSKPGGGKSVSELGHRTMRPSASPVAPPRMTTSTSANPPLSPSSTPKDGASARPRARASASTSALQPNAAARRASVLAAQQQLQQLHQPQPQSKFGTLSHMLSGFAQISLTVHFLGISHVSPRPGFLKCNEARAAEGPFSPSPHVFVVVIFEFLVFVGFR